jgi:type I restriction enzyme M protein
VLSHQTLGKLLRGIGRQPDHALLEPPFSRDGNLIVLPARSVVGELQLFELSMDMLTPGGRLSIVVPDGILFRGERAFRNARHRLLTEFALIAVVRLPLGAFPGAPSIRTSLLVCERGRAQPDPIRYYQIPATYSYSYPDSRSDLSGGVLAWVLDGKLDRYSWEVRIEDIERDEWSLDIPWPGVCAAREDPSDPGRQAVSDMERAGQLALLPEERDWLDAVVIEPLGSWIEERGARAGSTSPDRFLGVSKDGIIPPQGRPPADTRSCRRLEAGDIVYNPMRAALGSFALCRSTAEAGWVSRDYVVFRLTDGAPFDSDYLLAFLKSETGRVEIRQHSHGSVRHRLRYKDLELIPVPCPVAGARADHRSSDRPPRTSRT